MSFTDYRNDERLYRAYVEIDGRKVRIFPKTKKRSLMTIAEAEKKIESLGRKSSVNIFGKVIDENNKIVFCMMA